jgi:type IV secretory pathway ATPase VirB11/archaellum biosynthesis ATPase
MPKSINIKKLNNETIKVIPVAKTDPKAIKGYNIIPMLYANIFICAQKRSGKTNLINKILDSCIDSTTKVIVFASTHELDDNWKYIKKQLEKRKINAIFYSSIEERPTNNLQEVLTFMSKDLTS